MSIVSIIVPVYNVAPYLDHCVQSLVDQSYKNLEIILVDDGSSDDSPALCDAWAKKDPRIKVIHKPNGGVSDARNKGLSAATGVYLCFIDADDYVSPSLVEKLVRNSRPDGIAVCNLRNVQLNEPAEPVVAPERTFTVPLKHIKDLTNYRGGLFCCGILFPRELILSEPKIFFDTQLTNLEDAAWTGIVLTRVKHMTFVDWENALYFYLIREGSATQQCVDARWQASCWVKARRVIEKRKIEPDDQSGSRGRLILKQMSRHCLNNFYGECFAGKLSFNEIKSLGTRPLMEAFLYKAGFSMRACLRRR